MGRQNYSAVLGACSGKLHGCSSFTQEISHGAGLSLHLVQTSTAQISW